MRFDETRNGKLFYEVHVPALIQALERIAGNLAPVPVAPVTGKIVLGAPVLIRSNPHHPAAVNVTGTVVGYRAGEGFGGVDLADVEYQDPLEDTIHIRPFAPGLLAPMDSESLIRLAEHHEAMAAELRRQAVDGSEDEDRG